MVQMTGDQAKEKSWMQSFFAFIVSRQVSHKLPIIVTVLAVIAAIATYYVMTRHATNVTTFNWLLNIDVFLLFVLGSLIGWQILKLWRQRKEGIIGAKLHARFVYIFTFLTATPAVVMALFSAVFFYFGVQSWFGDRVSTAVNQSLAVAQSYLNEHQQVMRADVLAMVNDLNKNAAFLVDNPEAMNKFVETQSYLRNLSEALVFSSSGRVLARSRLTFALEFDPLPERYLEQAQNGEVVLFAGDAEDRIRALVKLEDFPNAYLFVGRVVDAKVLNHLQTVETAVAEYTKLEGRRSQLQISITLLFIAVALILILAAVWFGLIFADHLAQPILQLIAASEKIRDGDLTAKVPETGHGDELDSLAAAYNKMTDQLKEQQDDLLEVNNMLDERRRFTEAVLAGASSGVIGLKSNGDVFLANASASELLGVEHKALLGQKFSDLVPDMADELQAALIDKDTQKTHEWQFEYKGEDGTALKTLLMRVTIEQSKRKKMNEKSAVVTLDDISDLVSAQRKAAWADVARRIAHEIKNPLTPIQLSAERLNRRYLKQIGEDPENFEKCTNTIIRQVEEIGRMISEFAAFARMPEPHMRAENIYDICQDAYVLQKDACRKDGIDMTFEADDKKLQTECDRGQLGQVLTNLLQNARDAITTKQQKDTDFKGEIICRLSQHDHEIVIRVADNGIGLPEEGREKLFEPYVTARKKKGTGLGLAIVKKIIADHKGYIQLQDNETGIGAEVIVTLPLLQK